MSMNTINENTEKHHIISNVNEYSVLSLILGVTLLIAAPILLNFNANLWSEGPTAGSTSIPMELAFPAGIVAVVVFLSISLTSIGLSLKGLFIAIKYTTTKVTPVVGVLISFSSLALWIIVSIDLILILDAFRHCRNY